MNMTEDEALEFFGVLFKGRHHIPRGGLHKFGGGWCVNTWGDLSTWDSDMLTRLVFLAHDSTVRAEISNSGPGMVKIIIHKRVRGVYNAERHPTLEEAVSKWREIHKAEST